MESQVHSSLDVLRFWVGLLAQWRLPTSVKPLAINTFIGTINMFCCVTTIDKNHIMWASFVLVATRSADGSTRDGAQGMLRSSECLPQVGSTCCGTLESEALAICEQLEQSPGLP